MLHYDVKLQLVFMELVGRCGDVSNLSLLQNWQKIENFTLVQSE